MKKVRLTKVAFRVQGFQWAPEITPEGVLVRVGVCVHVPECWVTGLGLEAPGPMLSGILLDLEMLDLEKDLSRLSKLINCTLGVLRGRYWPEVISQGGGLPRTGTRGSSPQGPASFLGPELSPSSVGWAACCHDGI